MNTLADLLDDELDVLFVKRLAWLLANVFVEVACRHKFGNDIVCHVIFKDLNELNDVLAVGASHLFGYLKLLELLLVFLVYVVYCAFFNDLHSDLCA